MIISKWRLEKENQVRYIEENSKIWDKRVENNDIWSIPVSSEVISQAREGTWNIVLTPAKPVPKDWFPDHFEGKKILCLASGGGQQGPVLAALGAIHPWSNGYIDDVRPVWKECARILKKSGLLLAGFGNPIEYIFNVGKLEKGILSVENTIPYADIEHMDNPETKEVVEEEGYIWSHTLEDQIQGQIEAGFAIIGFYEDIGGSILDKYINTSIATKAIKM